MNAICPCERCARPVKAGWGVCSQCGWTLKRCLAELPALLDELDTTLARIRSNAPRPSVGHSSDKPVPYAEHASAVGYVIRSTLVGWIRELRPDSRDHPADDPRTMARWLLARHHELVVHAVAEQAVQELTDAIGHWNATKHRWEGLGWAAVDLPDRVRALAEPCPEVDCGGSLLATMHDVGDPRPNLVWCDSPERHEWPPETWLRLGHRLGYGRTA